MIENPCDVILAIHMTIHGLDTCPSHRPQQNLDGRPPWCRVCGLTSSFSEPLTRMEVNLRRAAV